MILRLFLDTLSERRWPRTPSMSRLARRHCDMMSRDIAFCQSLPPRPCLCELYIRFQRLMSSDARSKISIIYQTMIFCYDIWYSLRWDAPLLIEMILVTIIRRAERSAIYEVDGRYAVAASTLRAARLRFHDDVGATLIAKHFCLKHTLRRLPAKTWGFFTLTKAYKFSKTLQQQWKRDNLIAIESAEITTPPEEMSSRQQWHAGLIMRFRLLFQYL